MSDASSAAAAGSSESDKEDDDAAVAAAAEARMASIHRGFASAKAKGIQAATRLMKELRQVCLAGSFEVDLVDDNLMLWEVTLFDWVFDPSSALHRDLAALSSAKSDLMAVTLRMHFPHDFPFAPPLVYIARPVLRSEHVFDGALCMEMLVDWQPQYGRAIVTGRPRLQRVVSHPEDGAAARGTISPVRALASLSGARVESACAGESDGGGKTEVTHDSARRAYENLKAFHDKRGWSSAGR